jgi:hypothetical protein
VVDSLTAALQLFDNKPDTIFVDRPLYVKPLTSIAPRGKMPLVFGPAAAVTVSFYSLDGRCILRERNAAPGRINALAGSACRAAKSNIIIAVWRENGRNVSRRILSAAK